MLRRKTANPASSTKRLERANSKGLALFVSAIRNSPQLIALIPSQNLLVCV